MELKNINIRLIREKLEFVAEKAKENPKATIAVICFLIFFVVFPIVLLILMIITIIFGVALLAIKLVYGGPSLKELFRRKRQLAEELNMLEAKFLRHKISPEMHGKIFREKQEELIKLEALINEAYNQKMGKVGSKEVEDVTTKKRHVLNSLLAEKRKVLAEMDIAEKKYLKRSIDAKTYEQLVQQNQQKLIELEAKIKELYSEQNIRKALDEMKDKLSSVDKTKQAEEKERQDYELRRIRETVEDLVEQMGE